MHGTENLKLISEHVPDYNSDKDGMSNCSYTSNTVDADVNSVL
jgi:hypothetical protein